MRRSYRRGFSVLICASVALLLAVVVSAQLTPPFRLTAVAINTSNVGATGIGTVNITIDRWSTEAQRKALIATFVERGPEKLLDALQDAKPVGGIGAPGKLAWDIRYAHQMALPDGGSQIIILTDRPVTFWEATNRPRISDYPFTLIDLRIKRDGTGEGKASIATKVTFDKDRQIVELENYANQPVMLNNIKVERR